MNTGKYTLKEFLTNHNLDQIIIPEIQRDYVWNKENVERFLQSIFDNSKRQRDLSKGISDEVLNSLAPEMRDIMLRAQKEKQNYCNVGFIYAYSDPEMPERYVLIDGQQRMTTLFLILLALNIKEKKQKNFENTYFKNKILKLDYKVREDSHEFLYNFVQYILNGNNIADISNKYWNFSEYQNDTTIQSVITNYKVISDYIEKNDLALDYVENFIEFWYFNTRESKQGEELYLYMNSRGETVSPNESIKANLLKGLSSQEKQQWGAKWELWQNSFWKYRDTNTNADKGIEEFLKWIKIIELTKSKQEEPIINLAEGIRKIKDSKKICLDGLSLQKIESYFNALAKILDKKIELSFNPLWLTGNNIQAIDYIKFIPTLMYIEKYPNCTTIDVKRFERFFVNITRFEAISKVPYNSLADIIILSNNFLESNFTDIVDIITFSNEYKSILTQEEIAKLAIYKQSTDDLRANIEKTFWEVEDYKLCDGEIKVIWECIDFDLSDLSLFDDSKLSEFEFCFNCVKMLFDNPTDLVRRALLTKGDFTVWDGYSTSLEKNRYSLINEEKRWKEQISSNKKKHIYKSLITDFGKRKKGNNDISKEDILNQIITDFLNSDPNIDWTYYFIKEPKLLSYCTHKKICWSDDFKEIALLQVTNVVGNNWDWLKNKLEI
ncbi:MAG: DUF262 domain-containing protein [Bacteroidales bacterium]